MAYNRLCIEHFGRLGWLSIGGKILQTCFYVFDFRVTILWGGNDVTDNILLFYVCRGYKGIENENDVRF